MARFSSKVESYDGIQKSKGLQKSMNQVETAEFQDARSIIKRFFESTTTHGLSRIYSARNNYIRFLWLLTFLVVFGLFAISVHNLVEKTTRYNATTNVHTQISNGLQFPEITFCNGNPFRESELTKVLPVNYTRSFGYRSSKVTEMKMAMEIGKLSAADLHKIGHPREVFLMKGMDGCFFQNEKCNLTADFQRITTPMYGNCFTFKSKGRIQKTVNSESGLFTMLNINQDDYSSTAYSWSSIAGAKVMIHLPDEILPESQAIYLAPGTLTDIKIEKKVTKRLEYPYPDKCSKARNMKETLGIPVKYTVGTCLYACYIESQVSVCGYATPFFTSSIKSLLSVLGNDTIDVGLKYKTAENVSQLDCLAKFEDNYIKGKVNCNCPPPCYEETFKITVSSAMWPSLSKAKDLLQALKIAFWQFDYWTLDSLYNNIVTTNIYFKDFTVETITQVPAYTIYDFGSDLGGQLGLWIGSSVFSVFEFGAFLLSILVCLVFSKK